MEKPDAKKEVSMEETDKEKNEVSMEKLEAQKKELWCMSNCLYAILSCFGCKPNDYDGEADRMEIVGRSAGRKQTRPIKKPKIPK